MFLEKLVGLNGFEPLASSLSGTRSNQLSYKPDNLGGGARVRTEDLLLAKQVLCQLSYTPENAINDQQLNERNLIAFNCQSLISSLLTA